MSSSFYQDKKHVLVQCFQKEKKKKQLAKINLKKKESQDKISKLRLSNLRKQKGKKET